MKSHLVFHTLKDDFHSRNINRNAVAVKIDDAMLFVSYCFLSRAGEHTFKSINMCFYESNYLVFLISTI